MDIDIFNNEERVLINSISKGENLTALTRTDVLNSLTFSRQIANEGDTMITGLLDGAIAKMNAMSDEEWDKLKMSIPFPVAQIAESEVSEVPMDEEVTE